MQEVQRQADLSGRQRNHRVPRVTGEAGERTAGDEFQEEQVGSGKFPQVPAWILPSAGWKVTPASHALLILYVSGAVFSASFTSSAMLTMISFVCGCTQSLSGVQLFRNPLDYSPPGSPVHGLFQARTLGWVATIPPPPPPGDLPNLRIEPASLESPVLTGGFFTIAPPEKPPVILDNMHFHSNFPPS